MSSDIYHRPIQDHDGKKYLRLIRPADGMSKPFMVDVYAVIEAFGITCPARQHAIKKILCAGLRGKGSELSDLKGTMDAMFRAIELQEDRERAE